MKATLVILVTGSVLGLGACSTEELPAEATATTTATADEALTISSATFNVSYQVVAALPAECPDRLKRYQHWSECRDGKLYRCDELSCQMRVLWTVCYDANVPCGDDYYTAPELNEMFPAVYPKDRLTRTEYRPAPK